MKRDKDYFRHSKRVTRGPRWHTLRMAVLERDGFKCRACNARRRLEVDQSARFGIALTWPMTRRIYRRCAARATRERPGSKSDTRHPIRGEPNGGKPSPILPKQQGNLAMLESVKIGRRQSEIRQALATLVGKEQPSEDETRSMEDLDKEYRQNETRYRAALIAEDDERRSAGAELETREGRQWSDLVAKFEVRQVALCLDEGKPLTGQTKEVVDELRNQGGYRGVPVPYEALETRAGETIASGTPDPIRTAPIIDRLFPASAASAMGARMVNIASGQQEYPVTTSSVSAAWAATETGSVGAATAYATADRLLKPNQTLGVQMKLTRRTLLQSAGIEDAVRRDMRGAIQSEMDKAVFLGSGASGQPLGVIAGAGTYGIAETAVTAAASWSVFRAAAVRFLTANAASGPGAVRLLIRPEVYDDMDGAIFDAGSGITEWDRLLANIPAANVTMTSNGLAAPAGSPLATKALLTTSAGGVNPIIVGTWGAIDVIRDPYSDAASGGLRLTGLVTMDVTVTRLAQLEVLTGVQ